MSNITNRLHRLERQLHHETHLTLDEQCRRSSRFCENLRRGIAQPSDLHGVSFERERYERYLVDEVDGCRERVEKILDAGEELPLYTYTDWCSRLLLVPPSQPVPTFLLEAFQLEFEDAWRQPWKNDARHDDSRRVAHTRCHLVNALGTPDAARLRHRIDSGYFYQPPPWPDGWDNWDMGIWLVSTPPHFPEVEWYGEPVEQPAPVEVTDSASQHPGHTTTSNHPPSHGPQPIDISLIV